jgi:hypothetical protein
LVLEHVLQFLGAQVPPLPADLFTAVGIDDPRVMAVRVQFEEYDVAAGGPSPVSAEAAQDPHVVAAAMLLYLRMLPHPIIPT